MGSGGEGGGRWVGQGEAGARDHVQEWGGVGGTEQGRRMGYLTAYACQCLLQQRHPEKL